MGLRALVTTSTLAWGVNMPARRVAVVGITRGLNNRVSPIDITQMVGRAGRTGLDDRGDAYVLLPQDTFTEDREEYSTIPNITSHMGKEETLLFHVIAEMETGRARTPERLVAWHRRTLAAAQGKALTLDTAKAVFAMLEGCHAIQADGDYWKPTALGRISSWLYFDPRNVWAWASGFKRLEERGWWGSDAALAEVLGSLPIGTLPYVSFEMQEDVQEFFDARKRLDNTLAPYAQGAVHSWAYWYALQNDKAEGLGAAYVRGVRSDIERVASAAKLIDKMWGRWSRQDEWDALALRVKYGIGRELVPLVGVPGVGAKRAKALWDHGFTSVKAIAESDPRGPTFVSAVGSVAIAKNIQRSAAALLAGEVADEHGTSDTAEDPNGAEAAK